MTDDVPGLMKNTNDIDAILLGKIDDKMVLVMLYSNRGREL